MDDPIEVQLRDGTVITIRPIRPEDRAALEEGFDKLSEHSRYLRFHTPITSLTQKQLRYLTEVDHLDHVALVAIDEEGRGLGVARYVRLKGEPEVAEAAVTVADEWQGRGVGTALLGALASSALRNAVRVFRNYVLAENTALINLFDELGATLAAEGDGAYRIDFVLPSDLDDLPDTPAGRVFKAAALGWLPSLPPLIPPIWPQGQERPDLREWLDRAFRTGRGR